MVSPKRFNSGGTLGNWFGGGDVRVNWTITGGTAPYTITIDGETRDGKGTYTGQGGAASVSCALEVGEVRYEEYGTKRRTYPTEPTVDSGYKLITASVTDADGLTAEAAVEVYTVLNSLSEGDILKAGHTYRLHGFLVTIPEGVDFEYVGVANSECEGDGRCPDAALLAASQNGYVGIIWIGLDDGTEYGDRDIWLDSPTAGAQAASQSSAEHGIARDLDAKLDELAAKLGELPAPPSLEAD